MASTVRDSEEDGFHLDEGELPSRVAPEDELLPSLIGGGVLAVALLLVAVALFTGSQIGGDDTSASPQTTQADVSASDGTRDATGRAADTDDTPETSTVAAMLTAGGGLPEPTRPLSPLLATARRLTVEAVTDGSPGTTLAGPIAWFAPALSGSQSPTGAAAPTTTTGGSSGSPTTAPTSSGPTVRPPVTEPPSTTSPTTSPPATDPPTTDPPTTEPPTTSPPATEPPTTEPPTTATTSPPSTTETTEPPTTSPPDTTAPDTTPTTDGGLLDPVCTILDVLGGC